MKKTILILSVILLNIFSYAETNTSLKLPSIEMIESEMEKFYSKLTPKQIISLNEEINDNTKKIFQICSQMSWLS